MQFEKATKEGAYLRLGIIGPSGSGKSFSALSIASIFGDNTIVLDSERGSSKIYASDFEFYRSDLDDYSPDGYVRAMGEAWRFIESEGLSNPVVVVDSISQEWSGKGGALELKDRAAARSSSKNSFVAWRDITPAHNRFIDTMLRLPCHLIVTMRAKTDVVIETINGKQVPKAVGIAPVQRKGIEYELNVVGEMDLDHNMRITNTRYSLLDGQVIHCPGSDSDALFPQFSRWLSADEPTASDYSAPEALATKKSDPMRALLGEDDDELIIEHPDQMTETKKRKTARNEPRRAGTV